MDALKKQIIKLATTSGAAVCGVADLTNLEGYFPDAFEIIGKGYPRAVVVAVRLQDEVFTTLVDRPTPLYFHNYRQVNYALDRIAFLIAGFIQTKGYKALAMPASQVIVREPMRGHISHRILGWKAGLGWWGRNNLLVNPDFGARLRYVSILTDVPLEPDNPLDYDCGECMKCVKVCPAGAIKENKQEFNLEACYAKLCEFRKIPYVSQHICGVCVKACSPEVARRAAGCVEREL